MQTWLDAGGRNRNPWSGRDTGLLCAILLGALALRCVAAAAFPNIHHADETYEYVEPAHRAVFGYGIVSWEFVVGARSWLLPGLIAGILAASARLGLGPDFYLQAIAVLLSIASLSVVASAFVWGRRVSPRHAVIAGVVCASWFELVYFAPKPLTEVVATDFLVAGLCLAGGVLTPGRLYGVGMLLGFATAFRIQLAPATATAAVAIAASNVRARWAPILIGAVVPIGLLGAIDWYTWGFPFHSIVANYRANVTLGKASSFGVRPFYFHLLYLARNWSGALVPVLALAVYGSRRRPLLLLTAAAILLSHSLIPHKEYRFIYPAIACLVVLAGLGTADVIERAVDSKAANVVTFFVMSGWVVTSLVLATSDGYRFRWQAASHLRAMAAVSRRPGVCGLALDQWQLAGGYSRLHHNVPIYMLDTIREAALPAAFNVMIAPEAMAPPRSWGFSPVRCFPGDVVYNFVDAGACIYVRQGGCLADPEDELNQVLRRQL